MLGLRPSCFIDRRKKKSAVFDIAGALESNLDRYPKEEDLWQLLTHWLDAAKRERLAERYPDYVKALERAMVVMAKAPNAEQAILTLQASHSAITGASGGLR